MYSSQLEIKGGRLQGILAIELEVELPGGQILSYLTVCSAKGKAELNNLQLVDVELENVVLEDIARLLLGGVADTRKLCVLANERTTTIRTMAI